MIGPDSCPTPKVYRCFRLAFRVGSRVDVLLSTGANLAAGRTLVVLACCLEGNMLVWEALSYRWTLFVSRVVISFLGDFVLYSFVYVGEKHREVQIVDATSKQFGSESYASTRRRLSPVLKRQLRPEMLFRAAESCVSGGGCCSAPSRTQAHGADCHVCAAGEVTP